MTLPLLNSQDRYDAWLSNVVSTEIAEARRDLTPEGRDTDDAPDDIVREVLMERQRHELRALDVFTHEEPQVLGNIVWYSRADPSWYNDVNLGDRPREALAELARCCLDADIRSEVDSRL
jgi:hypothetical protein